jgi:hypothetical protein
LVIVQPQKLNIMALEWDHTVYKMDVSVWFFKFQTRQAYMCYGTFNTFHTVCITNFVCSYLFVWRRFCSTHGHNLFVLEWIWWDIPYRSYNGTKPLVEGLDQKEQFNKPSSRFNQIRPIESSFQ